MVLLENELFISELTKLMSRCKLSGSLRFTIKKSDGEKLQKTKKIKKENIIGNKDTLINQTNTLIDMSHNKNQALIRVTLGKRKISTYVQHKDVTKFQQTFYTLLKQNMDGLRKTRPKLGKKTAASNKQPQTTNAQRKP